MQNKPNVLVAGFSRCGTTYLYNLLKQHPDIYIPPEKEINYLHKSPFLLSHPHLLNPRFFLPRKWYYKKFYSKKPIKIDFSVMTAYDKNSAERVKNELGDIKIIFITREKEKHQESIKKTMRNHGEKLKINTEHYSNFEDYIAPYKDRFTNILIIKMEELAKNPKKITKNILKFLNLRNEKINFEVYKNKSATYFEDKHKSRTAFRIFRIKRNILKGISHFLTAIAGH